MENILNNIASYEHVREQFDEKYTPREILLDLDNRKARRYERKKRPNTFYTAQGTYKANEFYDKTRVRW
tara:strand:+ start:164 stop:370 length:207 start_codon:yes stop_codon:yes gene_type:complete